MTIAHTNDCLWVQHAKPLALLSLRLRITVVAKQPVLRAKLRRTGSPSKTPDRWTHIFGTMPEGTAIVRRHVLERGEVERACRGEALLLAESNMDLLQMMLLWSRAGLQRRSAFIGEVERACRGEALLLAESNMDLLQMMLLWSLY